MQSIHASDAPSDVRFGVLGTGRITRRLVADLQQTPGVSVTAIASRDPQRAKWYADQFGIPHGVAGYDDLIALDDVDAVYVALPPALHAEVAIAAARQGKHLLCEKPLTTTLADAQRIDQACRESGVRWLDATAWLHHPRTHRMRKLIDQQSLGRLRHITSSVSFFEPFQSGDHRQDANLGGGCLLDLGWYAAGSAVWATASALPRRVSATGQRRHDVWYRVSAWIEFDDDLSATINCGYDTATRKWMEAAGEDAAVICDDFTRPWQQRPARFWVHDRAGEVQSETHEGNQERSMIGGLIEEIRGGRNLDALRRQALVTQATLEAIEHSLQQQQPVDLKSAGIAVDSH